MEFSQEELQFLSITQILKEAISIPKQSPRTFTLLSLVLVLPLSLAILLHSLLTHSITTTNPTSNRLPVLLLYQLLYLLFLFTFSLLSTASAVFTVASLFAGRPASFSASLRALPPAFRRLFSTFLLVAAIILAYHLALLLSLLALLALARARSILFPVLLLAFVAVFLVVHVLVTALWHMASVVTVLEPLRGVAAVRKSRELLRGKTREAAGLVVAYLAACLVIGVVFRAVVVRGGDRYGLVVKVLVGGVLVAMLVVVNVVGLLVQSVFYYVCKSYHHEVIDKSALHEHLGGYLGEYVPLKSNIQMESMDL